MDVGKPQRIHKVEPVHDPVPRKAEPEPAAPRRQEPVPERAG